MLPDLHPLIKFPFSTIDDGA